MTIDINRQLKARKIYAALIRNRFTPNHLKRFTPPSWELAAELAGYKKQRDGHIISDVTKGLVLALYATHGGRPIPAELRLAS